MLRGDHKPNAKDLFRSTGGNENAYAINDYEEADYYEETDDYQDEFWWEDDAYHTEHYAEDDSLVDDDASEVEQAVEQMEDAHINYVDSRRKMKEIAPSRGFFPVVAVPPSDFGSDLGKSYGKGKAKGNGRSKGKGRGQGKGGDKGGIRKFAFFRKSLRLPTT